MYARLAKIAGTDESNHDLPDTIGISEEELEQYYPIWTLWYATDRKFLPSRLMQEPEMPLKVLLEIDDLYERILQQIRDKENGERSSSEGSDTA